MKTMNVSIKGSEWGIRFLSLKQFLKSNADSVVEGEDFFGITKKGSKIIEFVLNKITPQMIRHELFHAFVGETNTDSVTLSSSNMEELSASIIETHLPEILTLTDRILTVGLDRE